MRRQRGMLEYSDEQEKNKLLKQLASLEIPHLPGPSPRNPTHAGRVTANESLSPYVIRRTRRDRRE